EDGLVELARMARHTARVRAGEDHRPRYVGRTAPQFAVHEVGEPAEEEPDRPNRAGEVAEREPRDAARAGEQADREHAAEQTAGERHAAVPYLQDLDRVGDEEVEIVEQHVPDAPAENDAERDPQDEVVEDRDRERRRPSPKSLVADDRARID